MADQWYASSVLGNDGNDGYGPTDRTDPTQADNWSNSFTSIDVAFDNAAAGDIIYAEEAHAKDHGNVAVVFSSAGTQILTVFVVCVNKTTGALANTALEKAVGGTTGKISCTGSWSSLGISYEAGGSIDLGTAGNEIIQIGNGYLKIGVNSTGGFSLSVDGLETFYRFTNVDLKFTGSGQSMKVGTNRFEWDGGAVVADASAPATLFTSVSSPSHVVISDVDLSEITTALVQGLGSATAGCADVLFKRCLLRSGVVLTADTVITSGLLTMETCDTAAGDLLYRFESINHVFGSTVQATNCHRTPDFSAKIVSSANTKEFINPLKFKLTEQYMDANPTITVESITDGVTLQNDEFWIEIEYPDVTDTVYGQIDRTSRPDSAFNSPANIPTSTAAWTEDLASEVKQKVAVTISGGATGIHTVWGCIAKPSTTVYVDPDVTVI